MGCFSLFPCFTSSKHHHSNLHKSVIPATSDQGHEKNRDAVLARIPTEQYTDIGSIQTHISESRDNNSEDQVTNDCNSKPVTIDLDVEKKENGKLGVLMQIQNERKTDKQINAGDHIDIEPKEESQNLEVHVELEDESDEEKDEKTEVLHNGTISDSSVSSYISIPPMDRYHNTVINEDEDQVVIQEDSTDSLFSLSIHPKSQSKSCPVEVNDDKEVNSPMKTTSSPKENDHNQKIDSLLNPVENLGQWNTAHAIPQMPILDLHQEKENLYLEQEQEHSIIPIPVSEDPSFKVLDLKGKVKDNTAVVSVTTSLSNWLVDFEKSVTVSKEESQFSTGNSYTCSDGATSWKSFEERPILGAWTIDDVKQISARSSPRKSPRRNPDETPIIGSVGSYWSHSAQGADSSSSCTSPFGASTKSRRNRENKGLSCHSSPAKRRLEKALNKSAV